MIKLKDLLKEEPKFRSVHTTSTFDSLFGRFYSVHVPLTTKFMQSILGKERVSVFHIGNAEYSSDIQNVGRIVGKKSALSTFTKVDKGEKLAKGKGIQSQGGIIYQLEGSLLVAGIRDMQTHPDKTGRRWVSPEYLAGKVAGMKMYKELQNYVKGNKRTKQRFDTIQFEFSREIDRDMPDISYEERQGMVMKEMNRIKNKWIKTYINFCMKMMKKYKKQIKRHILSQKDKPSKFGWNEIIVNQIKIKDIFLLSRVDWQKSEAEKIATGTVTVGSPAQFRKWYKQRGGVINDSSWKD